MEIKIHVRAVGETVFVSIHGLESIFGVLQKYGLEPYEDEDGIIVWFGYTGQGQVGELVEELRKITKNVEYVEESGE